jgi:hypothetical protein
VLAIAGQLRGEHGRIDRLQRSCRGRGPEHCRGGIDSAAGVDEKLHPHRDGLASRQLDLRRANIVRIRWKAVTAEDVAVNPRQAETRLECAVEAVAASGGRCQ